MTTHGQRIAAIVEMFEMEQEDTLRRHPEFTAIDAHTDEPAAHAETQKRLGRLTELAEALVASGRHNGTLGIHVGRREFQALQEALGQATRYEMGELGVIK